MKKCKSVLILMMIFAVSISVCSCGNKDSTLPSGTNRAGEESLYGTWYINSSDATIWFNDRSEDDENPTSDFTVKDFNLETLRNEPNTLNTTYILESNQFSYESFSGKTVSFYYQFNDDGSLTFTSADSGEELILTRKDSPSLAGNEDSKKDEDAFIPDYKPGNENIYGQPDRNLASVDHGQMGIQDEWIYYSNGSALYKMKYTEGLSTAQKIVDHKAWGINVVGDWIYFGIPDANTINKVHTDGTMLQTIVAGSIYEDLLYVADHYLFYKEYVKTSASETDTYLIKMDLDTGKTVRLLKDVYLFWGNGDHIYYINGNEDQTTYCMDMNGSLVSQYPVWMIQFNYYGERMFAGTLEYYSDGSKQPLLENVSNIGATFVEDHYLYFSMRKSNNLLDSKEYGLYGYDLDSGRFWKINGDDPTQIWAFGDGYIYYSLSHSTYVSPYYRCLPDGTGWEELKVPMYPN